MDASELRACIADWKQFTDGTGNPLWCGLLATFKAVAAEWEREHPADDGEAVDESWLRSVGVEVKPRELGYGIGRLMLYPVAEVEAGPLAWDVEHKGTRLATLSTRGDLRRLCSALGIPLAEGGAQ